jgi:hypothetical protein
VCQGHLSGEFENKMVGLFEGLADEGSENFRGRIGEIFCPRSDCEDLLLK